MEKYTSENMAHDTGIIDYYHAKKKERNVKCNKIEKRGQIKIIANVE